jgi:hypothetical protein
MLTCAQVIFRGAMHGKYIVKSPIPPEHVPKYVNRSDALFNNILYIDMPCYTKTSRLKDGPATYIIIRYDRDSSTCKSVELYLANQFCTYIEKYNTNVVHPSMEMYSTLSITNVRMEEVILFEPLLEISRHPYQHVFMQ